MSDTDITPELVDAVADWWDSRGSHAGVQRLRTEARHLAREQADEERIDKLVHAFTEGEAEWWRAKGRPDFTSNPRAAAARAGIRAVLAKLDEDRRPEGGVEIKPISWYRTMGLEFANKYFGFPPFTGGRFTASDGGKWVWSELDQQWELHEYGTEGR